MIIIPLLVGSIFLALGLNIILSYSRFKRIGLKISGHVKAIEKYEATTIGANNRTTTSMFFRPVVEYSYKDQSQTVKGVGSNEIRHKLNQRVSILIIENEKITHARIEDSTYYTLGIIFSLVGIVVLSVYLFFMGGSPILATVIVPGAFGTGYLISSLVRNVSDLVESAKDHPETNENSILIETKADYIKEITSHSFWSNIIAFGLMFTGLGILYSGYTKLPAGATKMLNTDAALFWETITSGEMPGSWENPLILCGIGAFFFLASLRSIYYVRKKYGGMMKM